MIETDSARGLENACTLQLQFTIIYFQILKLHMILFKLEMIQANTKLFFTEKRYHTNKSNTIKLP
jgi:hypothetical protein